MGSHSEYRLNSKDLRKYLIPGTRCCCPQKKTKNNNYWLHALRKNGFRKKIAKSTELKTLLDTLGYEQYAEPLARAGVFGMAELTATSKAEVQKMGVLPGHANLLLQRARKPSDAKQPKASSAPKPAPKAVGFFVGRSVLYTRGNGATVRAKVVKNHGNGKYDIHFQQDGNDVVRLSVPRAKLQIA